LLILGKNKNIISSKTHQLSFNTRPRTVLLTPPSISPTGSAGIRKAGGAAVLPEKSPDNIPCNGGIAGAGAGRGADEGGGGTLYEYERRL